MELKKKSFKQAMKVANSLARHLFLSTKKKRTPEGIKDVEDLKRSGLRASCKCKRVKKCLSA